MEIHGEGLGVRSIGDDWHRLGLDASATLPSPFMERGWG
jgi:hypothetical protein